MNWWRNQQPRLACKISEPANENHVGLHSGQLSGTKQDWRKLGFKLLKIFSVLTVFSRINPNPRQNNGKSQTNPSSYPKPTTTEHVHLLNDDSFSDFIRTNSLVPVLLLFMHQLSLICQKFNPIFEQFISKSRLFAALLTAYRTPKPHRL